VIRASVMLDELESVVEILSNHRGIIASYADDANAETTSGIPDDVMAVVKGEMTLVISKLDAVMGIA